MAVVKFGIHYFMWLHEQYWDEKPDTSLPSDGVYNSSHDAVVDRHVKQIAALGIDYVILHVPAMRADGEFRHDHLIPAAQRIIPKLAKAGLSYTLMIDVAVTGESTQDLRAAIFSKSLQYYGKLGLLAEMVAGPSGRPLLLTFSPPHNGYADELNVIVERHGYEVRHLAYYPEHYWDGRMSLAERNFARFWQPQARVDVIRGFASVIPGYNDKLYGRVMQVPIVPRAEGKLLHNQLTSAIEGGAQHVLIYGWNEYIEATQIEPTKDDGGAAYCLTKALIEGFRSGHRLSEETAIELWYKTRLAGTQVNVGHDGLMKMQSFIDALYEGILGRTADPQGRSNWMAQLRTGGSPAKLIRHFMETKEARRASPEQVGSQQTEVLAFHDMTLIMKSEDPVQEEIRRFGVHEPWVSNALLDKLTEDSVVADIGANIGSLTLLAARRAPRGTIYAIEAFPENSKFLQENVRRNGINNVKVIPIGASDQSGSITMYCGSGTSNGAVRGDENDVLTNANYINVPSITLDQLFCDLKRLDLIKIDIEGHEPKALKGAGKVIRQHKPTIICEFSPVYIEAADCGDPVDFLRFIFDFGYSAKVLHRTKEAEDLGNSPQAVMEQYHRAMEQRITHLDLLFEPL